MGPEIDTLTVAAVLLMGGLMIAQSLFLGFVTTKLVKKLSTLDRRLSRLSDFANTGLRIPHRILDVAEEILQKLPGAEDLTDQVLTKLKDTTEKCDQIIAKKIERIHMGVQETHQKLDRFLSGFSQKTFELHSVLLNPAMRLSALIQAGVVTLKKLLSRDDGQPIPPPDKQIFI